MFTTRIIVLLFLSRAVSSVILIFMGVDVVTALVEHQETMYYAFTFLAIVYGMYYFRRLDINKKQSVEQGVTE